MNTGPLTEEELEWLDNVLLEYGNDASVMDVSELDGMLTAILSSPNVVEPARWLAALWGDEEDRPEWPSDEKRERFQQLTWQHMNDIAERLNDAPDQFAPLFGISEMDGEEYTVVEDWCVGYLRGVALGDWAALPEQQQKALDAIALHGMESRFSELEQMTPEAYIQSQNAIGPAALTLHRYWLPLRASKLN
ncbi:UPF0149 family protein [Pantoea sp. FN060301]|uniref:UPF0149 family protein n=1 Tax=Pantoea sp. FN060301 TaxID=3420380 RepID=UPI003D16E669